MKLKNVLLIFLFILIIGFMSTVSAVSDDNINNTISEIDYNDAVSVVNDDLEIGVIESESPSDEEYELNTQSQNESLIKELKPSGQTFNDIQKVIDNSKDNDTIKLSGIYFGSGESLRLIYKSLTFCGENNATLDARNLSEIVYMSLEKPVTFTNIKFINYDDYAIVDPFLVDSLTLTVVNCSFIGNHKGTAIYSNSKCLISNCTFINNYNPRSMSASGAIYCWGSVFNSVFINNYARTGGAIYMAENVVNCVFINNSAEDGGAIYRADNVVNCVFINNSADRGSVIYSGTVGNSSFINNTAGYNGNLVSCNSINGSSFINNSGGGILNSNSISNCLFAYNDDKSIIYNSKFIINCSFIKNNGCPIYFAKYVADCVFINNGDNVLLIENSYMVNCTFINNTNQAVNVVDDCQLNHCNFINNTGPYGGGAISISGENCQLNYCNFINNTANHGGAVYIYGEDHVLNYCNFINNTANGGGAIYNTALNVFVNNTLFSNNKINAIYSQFDFFIENYTLINQTKDDLNLIEVESKINATFSINCSDTYFRFKNITVKLTDSSGNPVRNQRILIELSNGTTTRMTTDSDGCIMYKLSGFGIHNLTFSSRSNIYNITKMSLNNVKIDKYDYLTPYGQTTDDIQYILDNAYDGDLIKLQGKYITSQTTKLTIRYSLTIEGDKFTEFDSNFLGFDIAAEEVTIRNIPSNIRSISGNAYSNLSVINCLFANNIGSAIHDVFNLTIINCSFVNNHAYEGGAISACKGMKIYNSFFINNHADYGGGAIYLNGYIGTRQFSTTYLFNCSFISNVAENQCGAISNGYGDDDWVIVDCYFINNSALRYGASFNGDYINCYFINNSAKYYASISEYARTVNCSFINNKDISNINNVVKLSVLNKEFTYNSGKTIDVKVIITDSKYYSTNDIFVAVGKSKSIEGYISRSWLNSDGIAHLKISTLNAGTYEVMMLDMDTGIIVGSYKIKINKAKPSVSAPKVTTKYKKSKYFKATVKLNKKALKNLKVKVKIYTGKIYKKYTLKTDKNGIVKINTKKLKKGTHKVVISSGNSNYSISKSSKIIIK